LYVHVHIVFTFVNSVPVSVIFGSVFVIQFDEVVESETDVDDLD
jgi:hypothetical protein